MCGGDQELGAKYIGWSGTASAICTFLVVHHHHPAVHARRASAGAFFVAIGLSIIGYGLKWICYNPDLPWMVIVPAPLMAFGLGGLFTVVPAMVADVVDEDTSSRPTSDARACTVRCSGSWSSWACPWPCSERRLSAERHRFRRGPGRGSDPKRTITLMRLFDTLIPMLTSAIAIWAVAKYPITESRALATRRKLEERRGAV